jgi:hypothetical protein
MSDVKEHEAFMWDVLDHKRLVAKYVQRVANALFGRAVIHDYSKFGPDEFAMYAQALPRFQQAEYGTEAYRVVVESVKPAIQHHVTTNRHHPEYFADGINGMNLIDLLEMTCDWLAASQRVPGNRLRLDLQQTRFGIDPQLLRIISNTVEYLEAPHDEESSL